MEESCCNHRLKRSCTASDCQFPWTVDVAIELGIPRLAFSGSGFFNLGVANSIDYCQPHGNVASETESLVPDNEVLSSLFDELKKAERKS
jgi:hypothetical protein